MTTLATWQERLVALGCPMGLSGAAYVEAGGNGDLSTLRHLRRLDCPWEPHGATFSEAVYVHDGDGEDDAQGRSCSVEVLRWLRDQGCPVDWREAKRRAERRVEAALGDMRARLVLAWVEMHVPMAAAPGGKEQPAGEGQGAGEARREGGEPASDA